MMRVLLLGYDPETVDFLTPLCHLACPLKRSAPVLRLRSSSSLTAGGRVRLPRSGRMRAPGRQWRGNWRRRPMIVLLSEPASACHPKALRYLKSSLTPCARRHQALRSRSTRGPMIVPMRPLAGCPVGAGDRGQHHAGTLTGCCLGN